MAFTSKPSGMSDAAWEIYQKKSAVPTVKDSNKPSVERSKAHVVGDDPFQASLNAFAETKKPRGISDGAWEVYKSANAKKIYSEWQSSMSLEDLEKLSLLKKGDSVTSTGKVPYNFGAGKINYGEKATELKQTIKNNMLAGTFGETKPKLEDFSGPKDTSRSLVEQYAYYEWKALEDSLKSGSNEIIPIGENISKFFDENGKNFAELYPDLANQYSTDNLTAYAYQTIPEYKKQVDENYKNSLIEKEKALLRTINFADTLRSENTNAFERPLKEAEAYLFDFGDYVFGKSDTATGERVANIEREDRVINESLQELADIRAVLSDEYGIEFEDDIKDLPQPSRGYKDKLFTDWFMANGVVGLANVFSGIASTVDFITPDAIFGEDNVFSETNQYWKDDLAKRNENAYKAAERLGGGTGWHLGGEVVAGVTQALPDMLIMAMSGGASEGAKILPTVSKWGASKSAGAIAKESVEAIAKDPAFWSSYIQTLGPSYEQALERGATPQEAAFTAIISSTFNSAIETGGVQKLPKTLDTGNSKAVLEFVKSTLDEGKEEVLQSITSDIVSKFIYDKDAPIFSTTDTNAIIDPSLIKDFGMGVTVGGILGAPVAGASFIETRTQVESAGKYINQKNLVNDLIKEGLNAPKGSELYKFAAKLSSKNNISNYDAGKLFVLATENNNSDTFYKDLDNAEKATSNIKSNQGVPASSIIAEKLGYKGGAYAGIQSLIKDNEATSYIADIIVGLDKSVSRSEAINAVNEAKQRAFAKSLENTTMSDFEKSNAIKEYVLKEQALDRMYQLGSRGFEFDVSMGAGLISEADAYKAFTRGENAAKAQKAAAEKVKAAADARIFDEAPTAPSATEDIQSEKSTSDVSADVDTIIGGMGSMGRTLYNKILNPVAGEVEKTSELKAAIAGFAHVYESGFKGVPYKRSQAKGLHIKEINAIYEAGKKDAAARVNVKKKTDAKVIKDESFKAAKVSKRTERILSGVSKIIGRDIRFSDKLDSNAKIDFESGEIIISTKAKSGHTWAMIHEVYHALVIDSPAEAEILKKTVLDIAKKNPEAYKRFRKKYEITYDSELFDENNKMRIDASEYISEEMVADLVGFTLSEPAILEKLTGQQRNILQKFVDKLVSMFGNADAESKEEYFASRFGGDIRAIFKDVAREADSIAEQFKAALDTSQKAEKNTVERDGVVRNSLIGIMDDGRKIYKTNYPDNAPKGNKQLDIIALVQKIWHKKPIRLLLNENGETKEIYARFDPVLNERSDLSKIAFGNRKGTGSEKRITLNLSYDLYQIASDASYVGKKDETGKDNPAHEGVEEWLYFVTNLVYEENDGSRIDCYMNIDVKRRADGEYFYSFGIEKGTAPQTLLAEVSESNSPTVPTNNYTQKNGNVNRNSRDIFTKADEDYMKAVESGDIDTAQRMVEEAAEKAFMNSKVRDNNGKLVHVYHGTSKGGFTVFDTYAYHSKFGLFGNGAYFTEDRSIAEQYTSKGRGDKPQIYNAYLNITNPIDMDAKADISLWNKALERADLDYITLSEGMTNEGAFREVTETLADEGYVSYEAEETVRNIFENMGYDGITHIGGGRAGKSDGTRHRVWIAFESEQIKSADPVTYDDNGDVVPLSERFNPENKDIRWSKELFPDDRTMSAEDIERDEIEQYIQQIKSSDDLSDADVQAIREEITQSRKQQREQLLAEIATTNLARWGADLGRQEESGKVLSINEAIKKVEESFGVKVTNGGDASVSGKNVSSYNESTRTIRTKFKNDLPAVCHALGYHIDKKLGVVDKAIEQTAEVRKTNGDGVGIWEAQLLALANYDGKDSRKAIKEGFAEFIRMYLVSKNLAQEAAPIFYSEFETILKEDAELQKAVETSAEAVSGYFKQSAEDRGSGAIMTKAEWDEQNRESIGKRAKSKQIKTVQTVTDAAYGIKAVEKSGGVFDLTTSDDAYIRARLTSTSKSRAARLIADDFYDSRGNRIGDSLVEIIKPLGKESSEKFIKFGDYLCFVHALEWIEPYNQDGKKTSSGKDIYKAKAKGHVFKDETLNNADELRKIIAGMETKYPDFKGIAKKVYEYQDRLMEYYLIPSGALSRDQAETFRAQYPHYVPFNRFNTVFGEAIGNGKKNSNLFANLSNPIRKADGGDAPIRHPLESIIDATYKAVVFLDQGEVMAALDRRFTGLGSTPGVMERIYSTKELEKLSEKGQNPFSIEEGKTVDENKNPSFNPVVDKEKGIVYRWVNGEKVFYQVYNRDLFNSLVNLDVEELGKIMNNINKVSNLKKKLTTMWNPVFSLGNAIKDFQSFTKNSVTARGAWEYLGPLRSLAAYVSSAKSLLSQDEYFKLYKAMGGMDSTRLKSDVYDIQKDTRSIVRKSTRFFHSEFVFDAIFRGDFKKLKRIKEYITPSEYAELWNYSHHEFFKRIDLIRNTINFVFGINDFVETLPRLAEFKASMKLPESKGDERLAFYRSQDVTVDFSRKGTAGRHINAIFLFSNANLQGIDKMIRNYTEAKYTRKNKKGEFSNANVAKKIISNLTFDLIMTALIAFCLRDEEDREEYNRLSEFTKNNYYCFHTGDGKFIKIPKGENSMFPQTLTQRLWDASQGDDVDLAELGGYVWDSFMPGFIPNVADFVNTTVNGGGLGEAAKIALNTPFNNTVAAPLTDVLMGYDYKGDKIVPNSMSNYEHNYQKYSYSTSEFSVSFARNLYEKTGIDISPISIDYFINGSGGYYGSAVTRLLPDSGGEKTSLGERIWDAVGLERKFTVDARYSTATLDRFYNDRDAAKKTADRKPTAKNLMANEKYQTMSSLMSDYNRASRTGSQDQQRLDREMLQIMLEGFNSNEYTEGEEYVMKLYDSTKNDKVFKTTFPKAEFTANVKVGKKKVKKEVSLDANTYAQFCADISNMREKVRILVRDMGLDDVTAASFLEGAYTDIDADMKAKYAEKYGKYPLAVEDGSKKNEVSKKDQTWFNDAYEDALNNEIYGD